MRFPCVRLTVRRMIVIVAIAALMLGAEGIRRRWAYFRHRAIIHAKAESRYGRSLDFHRQHILMGEQELQRRLAADLGSFKFVRFEPVPTRSTYFDSLVSGLAGQRDVAERYAIATHYHAAMRIKYEQAARFPWRSVNPDPPAPE